MTFPIEAAPEQTISITVEEYDQLLRDSTLLMYLKAHGVDNWCGWDDAYEDFEGGFDE